MSILKAAPKKKLHISREVWLIIAVAIMVRIAFRFVYTVWWSADSASYASVATTLFQGRFDIYDGMRTPGYPLFLIIVQFLFSNSISSPLTIPAASAVTVMQSELGLAGSVLFYLAMLRMAIPRKIALAAALVFTALAQVAVYEMIILPESLSLFFVILSMYLQAITFSRMKKGQPYQRVAVLAGLVSGFSTLVRPNNLVVIVVFLMCIAMVAALQWCRKHKPFARALAGLCLIMLFGASLPLGGWLVFNHHNTGVWTITPAAGANRACMAYNLFSHVEPQDKVLGDILQKYYLIANANGVVHTGFLWESFGELADHAAEMPFHAPKGYPPFVYLAQYLDKVSMGLLLRYPDVWLANGLHNFYGSFHFPIFPSSPEVSPFQPLPFKSVIKSETGLRWVTAISNIEQVPLLICYLLTFITIFITGRAILQAKEDDAVLDALLPFVLAMGSIASVVATSFLVDFQPRYAVPVYPMFVAVAAWACASLYQNSNRRRCG